MSMRQLATLAASSALLLIGIPLPAQAQTSTVRILSTFDNGGFDEGAAEIPAYDPNTRQLFITNAEANTVDRLFIADPTAPLLAGSIDLSEYGGGVNSVATNGSGLIAVAVEAEDAQAPGAVVFFGTSGAYLNQVQVGALPDMVTFTPDGNRVLVANEGEPSDDYTVDPEGSVSIIDISAGVRNIRDRDVTTADFRAFSQSALIDNGVRIFGPGATAAQDLEPEYIAVSEDGELAYVSLQENNALGILDVSAGEFVGIATLGVKEHRYVGNELDASNEDDAINITTHPVLGMYQPDAIASFTRGDKTYILSANEGDARDYDAFSEEARVADLTLDPEAFPDAAALQTEAALGRLTVTNTLGDTDGDGDFDALYAYGARSFSVWDENGNLVWDSGSQFERITAEQLPTQFNATNDDNNSFDDRSDDKGPEPEGITLGVIENRRYAFIGLERIGGVMVYDVTNPSAPQFVTYFNNRDFSGDPEAGTAGDLAPEGLLFIAAAESPNQEPLLVVTNEVSGTTTIYSLADL